MEVSSEGSLSVETIEVSAEANPQAIDLTETADPAIASSATDVERANDVPGTTEVASGEVEAATNSLEDALSILEEEEEEVATTEAGGSEPAIEGFRKGQPRFGVLYGEPTQRCRRQAARRRQPRSTGWHPCG